MSFTSRRVREEKKPSAFHRTVMLALPLIKSFIQLKKHVTHVHHEEEVAKKRQRILKKTIAILLSTLLVLVLLIGTLKALLRLKEIALGVVSFSGVELQKDENGFTNVLVLGEGDNDHDGIDLTDTIMIVSLDPVSTKSAVLISIPRDTYLLKTEKMGAGRINSLYRDYKNFLQRKGTDEEEASKEALHQLDEEIGNLIGIKIQGAIKVNFSGFTEAIDAIGGIDIDVPEDIVDREYPGPNYSYETFSISKGVQHLDGATALKYARTRHSTSDFSRSSRQQQIIAAASQKLKDDGVLKNAGRITELLSIVAKNVDSTFSTRELMGLATLGKTIDRTQMIAVQINDQNGLYGSSIGQGGFLYSPPRDQFNGAAVLLPVSVPEFPVTWKQIEGFTRLLVTKRELFLSTPTILVLNAGAKEGSARKVGGELFRYMFNVENTRNYARKNPSFAVSSIVINPALSADPNRSDKLKAAEKTAAFLSSILGITIGTDEGGEAFAQEDADIAIVLGKDFTYTLLQDSL